MKQSFIINSPENNLVRRTNGSMFRKLIFHSMLLLGMATTTQAQVIERPEPKFWFGASAGANFNFYTGTTQRFNSEVKAPTAFHEGFGVGQYGSVLVEYRPDPVWGLMLNLGYDSRQGSFDKVLSPCNCPESLGTTLSYLTIEPSLRIAPFSSGFYMFVGGAYSYNINKEYTYTFERDPANPFNTSKSDFSDIYKNVFSAQVGMGYDIPLASVTSRTQVNLSPFISYHPYFGQEPRSVESWSISTVRVGIALKFGRAAAKPLAIVTEEESPMAAEAVAPVAEKDILFTVQAPVTVLESRDIKETFPLRNYVFFDADSKAIPSRYVKLNKEQASNFSIAQFQNPAPKDSTGRSKRQLKAYYNILNILGKRMNESPDAHLTLIGSSAGKGSLQGLEYAESVKIYLVNVYGIQESRITTEGRNEPLIPSIHPGGTIDLELLSDGDRRVDLVSSSPDLLTPVQVMATQEDPMDSRIIFKTESNAKESLKSWTISVTDDKGKIQQFGPFTKAQESISGNNILGDRKDGHYKVVMLGQTKDGNTIRRESSLYLVHNSAPKEDALRFSVLFDFDKSKSVDTYEKFLTEEVAPLIPDNGTVIIHGHSDIIGDTGYNLKLSERRAIDIQNILEKAVLKSGKKDVKYEVFGFGADSETSPFENKYPEERFYNRTVIIDIVSNR